jgi:DNA-binding transcriptional LysR family regulator
MKSFLLIDAIAYAYGMELYQLRAFVAVAETRSFTRGAARVATSQPAVSAAIAKLEGELELRLLERSPGNVSPTPAGQRLLVSARDILKSCTAIKADLRTLAAPHILRIGVLRSLPTASIATLIDHFSRAHPDVSIRLKDGTREEIETQLANGRLDACLTELAGTEPASESAALFAERYVLIIGPGHRFSSRNSVGLADLDEEPFIQRTTCETYRTTTDLLRARGIRPTVVYSTDQDDRALGLVAAGFGIALMPETFEAVGVHKLTVSDFEASRTVGIRWRPESDDALLATLVTYAKTHQWR